MLKQQHYTLTNVKKVKIAINHPFKLRNSSPNNENVQKMYSLSGNLRCR